jgi:hypothetical protein
MRHAKDRIAAQDEIASQLEGMRTASCRRAGVPQDEHAEGQGGAESGNSHRESTCSSAINGRSAAAASLGASESITSARRRRGCSRPCAGKALGGSRAALPRAVTFSALGEKKFVDVVFHYN